MKDYYFPQICSGGKLNCLKKHNITADDLYELLKEKYGFDELITLIDTYVLESEFEDYKTTAKDYANNYIKGQKTNFNSDEEFLNTVKQSFGFKTIDEYNNYVYLSYMQSHAIEEYAKSLVTDKRIEKYYKEDAKENVETYHILITPKVKDDMNDDEKYIKHTKYHAKHFISLFLLSQLPFHYSQSLTTYLDIRFLKKKKFYDRLFQTYAEVERIAHIPRFSFNNIDQFSSFTPPKQP